MLPCNLSFVRHHLFRFARKLRKENGGSAVVEFAIVVPFFIYLMVGAIDFGRAFYEQNRINSAAAAGANFALQSQADYQNSTQITTLVRNNANDTTSALTVTSTECSCPSGAVSGSGVTLSACSTAGATGTACSGASVAQNFVQVLVSESITTMAPYPFLTSPYTLRATATDPVNTANGSW